MGVFTDSTSSGSTDVRLDDFEGGDIGGTPPPHTITGTGDVTLPVSALAGTGQVEIVGTGDITLSVSALAGTGVIQIDGTGALEYFVLR